jgi:maleylacetate reductase
MNNLLGLISGHVTIQAQERVVFGEPAEKALLGEAARYGAQRIFIVSTRSLSTVANGPLQRVEQALGPLHVGTFAAIRSHSPREDVIAAANAARGAKADLLVAIGGGSVIDAAKAVQICLWLNLDTPQAMEPYRNGAAKEIAQKIAAPHDAIRMISISTTLSASEFTSQSGVTDSTTNNKQSFSHRLLVPRSAILDPAATLDTPEWLLYSTAIRSVDHAVESYCAPSANPITEATSLNGLRLLSQSLREIKNNPRELAPRLQAQFGMWQSISASAAGVPMGASHGIGYALGASFGIPHGHTSCVMLPAVLRWNSALNADRQRSLSAAMGAPDRPAAELVAELIHALDLPGSLSAVGIKRDQLQTIAASALSYGPVRANPRPIKTAADVMEILELAW